ncbi:hypothetical protein EDC04DRAFT_2893967 [Pisolithus marmoratus]|nr:hypothetical protein EDC04DRAFT_2893967 [Pisolithus marmoratus]
MLTGHDEDRIGSARDDLVFDEVSPNKDNHFAKSVVCSEGEDTRHGSQPGEEHSQSIRSHSQDVCLSGPMTTQRGVEDVVIQHHQCNHGPHLPDGAQLMAIHNQQMSKASCHIRHSNVEGQTSPSNDVVPTPSHSFPAAKSATSGVTSDSHSDPSQLQFYSPSVHDIIEHACDYILEAITECHSKGLLIPDGWWVNYMTGITKLLWEDLRNWHSSLKKKAHFFVHEHYEWDSQNCCDVNDGIARKLLEHGDFLKDGVDEECHTNNLVHPALSALIIEFFYTGTNAMANIFPEVFQNEIKVALDEVVAEGKEVTKCNVYADVYADVLGLMAKCDTAPVHHAKTKFWDNLDSASQLGTLLGVAGGPGQSSKNEHANHTGDDNDDHEKDGDDSEVSEENVKLGTPQQPTSLSDVENIHKDDRAFEGFCGKLETFLNTCLPTYGYPLGKWI